MADKTTVVPEKSVVKAGKVDKPGVKVGVGDPGADEPVVKVDKVDPPEAEKSVEQLRKELVGLGFDEKAAKGIISKDALNATIKALKVTKEAEGEEKKIDPQTTARLSPGEQRATARNWSSKRERMREHLRKQPTVRILISCEGKEKPGVIRKIMVMGQEEWEQVSGAVKEVTLNGFKTLIPKGRYWDVPQQVAEIVAEGQQMTLEAGKSFDIERTDPKTGLPVADKL